jgi:Zn-dependent protease
MATAEARLAVTACPACGAEVAPGLLTCPACHALVHAASLKRLADEAEQASRGGDPRKALATWREALELLPPSSTQSKRIGEKIAALTREVESLPIIPPMPGQASVKPSGRGFGWAALGGAGLLLWKFKFVLVFVLSKLKLLALGFSKGSTVLSMLASAGVYWTVFGWKFAFGLVGSIYIHEIGHVAALQRLGIKASAPMFVPGLGAFIRSKQYPASMREDAYVGLAGPIWGMAAAIACFGAWLATGYGLWAALAEWGARINLFNLMPIWQLDGGRGFRAISRLDRWVLLGLTGAALAASGEGTLWLILIGAGFRVFGEAPAVSDRRAFLQYLLLLVVLTFLAVAPARMGAHAGP